MKITGERLDDIVRTRDDLADGDSGKKIASSDGETMKGGVSRRDPNEKLMEVLIREKGIIQMPRDPQSSKKE